jgi:hypothetical protein
MHDLSCSGKPFANKIFSGVLIMQQKPSHTDTDDTQKYEPSARSQITSTSFNVQEKKFSNNASSSSERVEDNESLPTATVSVVSLPESAFRRKTAPRWIFLSLLFVLLATVAYISFALANYINRSTPQKTLDAFCTALQKQDYKTAYAQFSPEMQLNFTEQQFAQLLATDKVVRCLHGAVDDGGTSATTSLSLIHRKTGGTNNDKVTLTKDSQGQWRITNLHIAE